jgi:NAD-dependent deacetylase
MNQALIQHLRDAEAILIFTGAGISTGSGIADFRGPQGVWTRRQPVYFQDFMASETSRIEHWDTKLESWPSFKAARPNPAHESIAQLERAGKLLLLVTQNIDGLHSAAGTSPDRLVELHGTNLHVECLSCGRRSEPDPHFAWFEANRSCPRCEVCGGFLKPATISFGQSLREDDLRRSFEAAQTADLVVSLGSTLSVTPAANVPLTAAERGIPYIIVNRGRTEHDDLALEILRLEGDVVEIFAPAVAAALEE